MLCPVHPAPFAYLRADSADAARAALAEHGDEAKLLAGGHSLLPLMKLRLATPTVLVDIGGADDLAYVRDEGDALAIGALVLLYFMVISGEPQDNAYGPNPKAA